MTKYAIIITITIANTYISKVLIRNCSKTKNYEWKQFQ